MPRRSVTRTLALLTLLSLGGRGVDSAKEAEAKGLGADATDALVQEDPVMVLPAAARAVQWVVSQRRADWGWGSDTAHTVLALRLANATWFAPENLEAQLVMKQLQMELVLRLWKHKELPLSAGHLAVNVMALVALCKDPRAFYSKDLVAMVEHQEGEVDFEVAFAQLATCTAGHHVRKSRIRKLLDIISDQNKIHSVDTLSVVILALHCAQHQRRHDLRRFIDQAMATLLHQQEPDGAFNSNLHSTALALQPKVDNFDAPDGEPPVPTENPDQPTPTPAAEIMANITYIIWKGNNATENFNLTFSVPVNTSFLTVMKMAAEQDERFVFSASHWGNGFYIHTLSGAKEQKLGYWFWLFYRLPEPPVPGTKPDNKYVVGTGVQETLVRDKDIFLFWFHQI
ncbi:uncharacterized protein CG3556-like [Penaeus chinensis]|uniref:uncharacterized protein CG3556-like n=1 Tax=Penaeus chinensis TaxID=139456 RepID=UPI001FB6F0DB|nr:uncharacterized protein CG3556-like [Penaeus chinensis]